MAYDRYKSFVSNGKWKKIPFISIPRLSTDKYTYYEVGKSRLDLISYQYYDDPNYGWLILQANPHSGSLEYLIPNMTRLRIPYPLSSAIEAYEDEIKTYDKLYGLE